MELPDLEGLMTTLANVSKWVNIVAKVVNPLISFMLPMLLFMGQLLYDFILAVNAVLPTGNYTWYIVATSVVGAIAIVLTILFPGEKSEDD